MITFGTRAMLRHMPSITINFCGTAIPESRVVKNLGLHMDRHLTFSDHVSHVVQKCSGSLVALMHAKHSLPKRALKPIVNALVISSIRYCISIYGTCSKTESQRIQKIINFAARVISGRKKYDHISDVIKELNWLSVSQLMTYHRVSLINKIIKTGLPETLHECITDREPQHHHRTRQADTLRLHPIKTETGRRLLGHSGLKTYNVVKQNMHKGGKTFKVALMSTVRSEP